MFSLQLFTDILALDLLNNSWQIYVNTRTREIRQIKSYINARD